MLSDRLRKVPRPVGSCEDGLAEIITAVREAGLRLESIPECLRVTYRLQAVKPA